MTPLGGLKLRLEGADNDRRLRFAALSVIQIESDEQVRLVTDSRGRLRYRLEAGEYELRLQLGGETRFVVGEDGWTSVRLQLP